MASSSSASSSFLLFHIFTILVALLKAGSALGYYTSIFSFGDSLADTGNIIHCHRTGSMSLLRFPYGMSYFHHAGRCSNGRLMIDFLADKLGLPFLPPYLGPNKDFHQGVNFAVAGATALDLSFLEERKIYNFFTSNSLRIQLEWFKELLPSLCSNASDCNDLFRTSLFIMGEIGGNDLNYPILMGHSLDEIQTLVPMIIDAISSAINTVIEYGARTIMVPGNFPIGCSAAYLTKFNSRKQEEYDPQTGCLKSLNEFSQSYNRLLKKRLDGLRSLHPNATILYADYYNAAMPLYVSPRQYGFSSGALKACCGVGGPYNYNFLAPCGTGLAKVCSDPSTYVSWDGLHLTEAAYRFIANRLMEELHFPHPITTSVY